MQIDTQWLRERFDRFNQHYFGSQLPVPSFRVGHSRTQLGTMACKRKRKWGRTQLFDFRITLSNYYDQTERQFQSVLLHEMIHLSIAVSGVEDTSPHGVVFRGMMERLNRDGWGIQVMTSTRNMRKAYTGGPQVIQDYLVLAIEMRDGKCYLSSVDPRYARKLDQQLQTVREVARHAWYTTSDRWFEDMPRVRTLRGRRVDAERFAEKTGAMRPVTLKRT